MRYHLNKSIEFLSLIRSLQSIDLYSTLATIDAELANVSYVTGWLPTLIDKDLFEVCSLYLNGETRALPHLKRWYSNIESYTPAERSRFLETNSAHTSSSIAQKIKNLTNFPGVANLNLDDKVRLSNWISFDFFS